MPTVNRPAASTTPRVAPSSTGAGAVTVQPGDSLGRIAKRAGVSIDALVQANVGRYPSLATNRDAIKVGWSLSLPGATTTAPAQAATTAPTQGWQAPSKKPAAAPTETSPTPSRPPSFGSRLATAGAQSIELRTRQHLDAIEKTGVGTYFGDHSAWKTMPKEEQQKWLAAHTKEGVKPPSPGSIKESSCIGWAMENVGAAYAAAGKTERWNEIKAAVVAKGSKGIDLAKELKKDGWQAVYWNPDAKNPNDGNAEHSFSAAMVAKGKGYYGIEVDAQVTNYRPTDAEKTKQDLSGIDKLKQVPFFFGLAKGGVHTFVGRSGEVNEFHWNHMPDSKTSIEQTPLKDFGWNSGLIMVPPGTWPK